MRNLPLLRTDWNGDITVWPGLSYSLSAEKWFIRFTLSFYLRQFCCLCQCRFWFRVIWIIFTLHMTKLVEQRKINVLRKEKNSSISFNPDIYRDNHVLQTLQRSFRKYIFHTTHFSVKLILTKSSELFYTRTRYCNNFNKVACYLTQFQASSFLPYVRQKFVFIIQQHIWTNRSVIVASACRFMMLAFQNLSRPIVFLLPISFFYLHVQPLVTPFITFKATGSME